MASRCVQCGREGAEIGILCQPCASGLEGCAGLLPDHIISRVDPAGAEAWLVDRWGHPHALAAGGTAIGRMPSHDLVILNGSVSRDHARLARGGEGWTARDLGSRNWTQIDGVRVDGRSPLADGARIAFGDAAFYFKLGAGSVAQIDGAVLSRTRRAAATGHAGDSRTFRFTLRGETVGKELCLIGTRGPAEVDESGGALLYRERGAEAWSELNLASLEFQLLNVLCRQWLEEEGSPAISRGCVATKRLAKVLPFQSRYANEENVRQVVRRARGSLKRIGVEDLIAAVPGRGYHLAWPVSSQ